MKKTAHIPNSALHAIGEISSFYYPRLKAVNILLILWENKHPRLFREGQFNENFLKSERELEKIRREKHTPKPSVDILENKLSCDHNQYCGCSDCMASSENRDCYTCNRHRRWKK